MGLDVYALRKLVRVSDDHEDRTMVCASPHFPGRIEGLEEGAYIGEACLFGPTASFRAGPYSAYGRWREWLAKLAGYPALVGAPDEAPDEAHSRGAWARSEGPFWELIEFYDSEGCIGPVVSAKLAEDFRHYGTAAHAAAVDDGDEGNARLYRLFWKAFAWASEGGVVVFT